MPAIRLLRLGLGGGGGAVPAAEAGAADAKEGLMAFLEKRKPNFR
jgi:1,4-dihydroxy-2-naphthoyl-CoA synthase